MSERAKDILFIAGIAVAILIVGMRIGMLLEHHGTKDCLVEMPERVQ